MCTLVGRSAMSGRLVRLEEFDRFRTVLRHAPEEVDEVVLASVRNLDERTELEPALRSILTDVGDTPHGPAEIVDVLTHKLTLNRKSGVAAFILKGKSFPKVRPPHVSHQIYRLEKIADLAYAVLAATGVILDQAKEQFISTAARVCEAYCLLDAHDLGRLLIGFGFLCPRDGRRISAGRCTCGYSPKKRILNVLQKETLKELATAHGLGQSAGLVILPPGSGKTRIAARDAQAMKSNRVLYVAHTHEILDVAEAEFGAVFGPERVDRLEAGSNAGSSAVHLATIQLLALHLNRIDPESYDYVIVDEFHHAAARTYRQLLDTLQPRFLLGLTATPFRGDRQDIAGLCGGNFVVNYELRSGIELGILTPYHYYGCFDNIDYSQIRHTHNGYNIRDLERALVIPERDAAIIAQWRKLAEGTATLAFCCSRGHAERMSETLCDAGVPAAAYLGSTPIPVRQELTDKLQAGDLQVLCVVDVLNEGADFPFVQTLLFLRPTESARIFHQQLGRGLRKAVGKSHCTVIDFIGNFKNAYKLVEYHGLLPYAEGQAKATGMSRTPRAVLNLPLGCRVHFDTRVVDLFASQSPATTNITRHNIGRILIYQYARLETRLGRLPTPKDVDQNLLLGRDLYQLVFGSWSAFQAGYREVRKDLTVSI